ncbi:YkgJ family cysteine cluster protein [Streptomyces sp. NPDC001089]
MELGDAEALVRAIASRPARKPDPKALDALYASLPRMECKGKCWSCCGPAPASPVEKERIRKSGVDWADVTSVTSASGEEFGMACTALDVESRRCRAYEARPMVCRIWGLVEELACPWGCVPEGGHLDGLEGLRLMNLSFWYGGAPEGMEPAEWERRAAVPRLRERMLEIFAQGRPVLEDAEIVQATIRVRPGA